MLLGYDISGQDNGYTMYGDLELDPCSKYRDIYSINVIDPALQFNKKLKNLSFTYDGFAIVSEALRQFCESEKYQGLEFVKLSGKASCYWLKVNNVVAFDPVERNTRFINFNESCNGYEEVIGANPVCLKEKTVLADGFYRTDLCFGSFAGKSPVYLIGVETWKKMKAAGFKDIDYEEILSAYTIKF